MKDFWNQRYGAIDYAYGTEPNIFFKQQIEHLREGRVLLPAEGEGRNAVFAACSGWDVYACDLSIEGKKKAMKLAADKGVSIKYDVGDFGRISYENNSFDLVAMIFAHFPGDKRKIYHAIADQYLKPGGIVLIEAFNKSHLEFNAKNPSAGGPRDISMLYSLEELISDFQNYELLLAENTVTEFKEGNYHIGEGSVCRFVARKSPQLK